VGSRNVNICLAMALALSGEFRRVCFAATIVAVAYVAFSGARSSASAASPPVGCTVQLATPLLVPIGTVPGGIVIDDACQFVYATNPIMNRVEVFSLQTLTLQEPIQVGAQPQGLDIRPGGASIYVANSGGNNVSVVDVVRRVETRKIKYAGNFSNDRPSSIAIDASGRALFATTFSGSGFGGRVLQLDAALVTATPRPEIWPNGSVTPGTVVRSSYDRSILAIGNSSALNVYRASTDSFLPPLTVNATDVGMNLSGTKFFVVPGGLVLDAGLNQIGTVTGGSGSRGGAVDPTGTVAYRALASKVEILNLITFLKTGEIALGDSVTGSTAYASAGQMDLSGDAKLLAVTTTTGFVLVSR
jgi:YVTN family beta-propeller protein